MTRLTSVWLSCLFFLAGCTQPAPEPEIAPAPEASGPAVPAVVDASQGFRVSTDTSKCFAARAKDLDLPEHLVVEITPLLSMLEPLSDQIEALDTRLGEIARTDVRVRRVMTIPQIGPVTAVSFVATLDDVGRFRGAHQVEAYLGLVPREWSSSEVQRRGRIPKAGNARLRWIDDKTGKPVGIHSHVGRLDEGLKEAEARGWTVVDMKNDWKRIFAFDI